MRCFFFCATDILLHNHNIRSRSKALTSKTTLSGGQVVKTHKTPLSQSFVIIRHRATFPIKSIIAAAGLNFGVRDGNQCIPHAKSTGMTQLRGSQGVLRCQIGTLRQECSDVSKMNGLKPTRGYKLLVKHLTLTLAKLLKLKRKCKKVYRPISTPRLNVLLRVHLVPINHVVYMGSNGEISS